MENDRPMIDLEADATQAAPDIGLRRGDLCPNCRQAQLDYDGLLNLSCPRCSYALGGCFG
jgi:hypothetical protein